MKFAQIYRRSMIPAVQVNRYTVSAFQLQQTFSKSVGFLMELVTVWIQQLRITSIDPLHRFQSRGDGDRDRDRDRQELE